MRFASREEADQGFTMPAHCLLDQTWLKLIRKRYTSPGWSRFSEAERDDGVGWWDFVAGRFRDARIVATYLEDATVDEARKAFLHICRVGVPMSSNDFDRALGWAASK
jgi:hypothetical protein